MTKDEALRLALEALELVSIEFVCNGAHHAKKDRHEWLDPCPIVDRYKEAITAIKAALEAKDEPVCDKDPQGCWSVRCQLGNQCKNTPPQRTWVGLTRDEILEARWHNKSSYRFARVLETKLKEKNT